MSHRCFVELLGFPSGELGPAVISRIDTKPGDYYENAYPRSDSLLSDIHRSNRYATRSVPSGTSIRSRATGIRLPTGRQMRFPMAQRILRLSDLSNTTDVSISADTEVNGITFTPAATNPYTITASPGLTLTISGVGITNNSGITQNINIVVDAAGNTGTLAFSNHATAGSNRIHLQRGRSPSTSSIRPLLEARPLRISQATPFRFIATTSFFDHSTAGNSTILNETGAVFFANNSTAGSASIDLDRQSFLQFANNSTAANSTITAAFDSTVTFLDNSTAASAFIGVGDGSNLEFADTSTAGSARIVSTFAGLISFLGSSRGGTSQIDLQAVLFR